MVVLDATISDHFLLYHSVEKMNLTVPHPVMPSPNYLINKTTMTRFQNNVVLMDWLDYPSFKANEAFNNFYGNILNIFLCSFPKFKLKAQSTARKPRITNDVLLMISEKNPLHQKYKCNLTVINREIYYNAHNWLTNVLRKVKQRHFTMQLAR